MKQVVRQERTNEKLFGLIPRIVKVYRQKCNVLYQATNAPTDDTHQDQVN